MPFLSFFHSLSSVLKKIGRLRLAAILFLALALFILIVEKPGSMSMEKQAQSQPLVFPRLSIDQVTHLTITFPPDESPPLEFRREGGQWWRGDVPAEEEAAKLFKGLLDLKKESVVSKNPAKHLLFGVDEKSPLLQLWNNSRELEALTLGKTTGENSQYVRVNESPEIWQVRPALEPLLMP